MGFGSGENWNGNANGRRPGSRNKRTEELWNRLESRGDKDPADFLSQLVTSESETKELRAQAANMLLPYKYSKCGTLVQPRFIEEPVELPRPTTIAQARENIVLISELKAQGRLDLDTADSLIADNKAAAGILIEEMKLLAQNGGPSEQHITISGGLPSLPGTDLVMPELNGGTNGHVLNLEKNAGPSELSAPEPPPQATNQ